MLTPAGPAASDRRSQRQAWTPLGVWSLINLALGSVPLAEGVYISQLLLLLVCGLAVLSLALKGHHAALSFSVLLVMALGAQSMVVGASGNPRFLPELGKTILLLSGAVIIAATVQWRDVRQLSRTVPALLCLILIPVWLSGQGDYYGDEGRFGVPWMGSPNNTGFVIAMGLALHFFHVRETRQLRRGGVAAPDVATAVVLLGFLFATQSLGGILSAAAIGLRFVGLRLGVILWGFIGLVVCGVLVAVFVPGVEVPELLGSGRLIIWQTLLAEMFEADSLHFFLGMGPGAIDLNLWFTASVQSAHSMYVEVFYAYGLVGLLAFVATLIGIARRIRRSPMRRDAQALLEAIFVALVIGFMVDTYVMSAQLTWFGALLFSLVGLTARADLSLQVAPRP
ncbi:MAG: hypothetical protein C4K60_09950 [Ideonella sp. MAG2]|nr:MAG: hypothetical protein C4K60_09950 [Ideonella sp. MAG2]